MSRRAMLAFGLVALAAAAGACSTGLLGEPIRPEDWGCTAHDDQATRFAAWKPTRDEAVAAALEACRLQGTRPDTCRVNPAQCTPPARR